MIIRKCNHDFNIAIYKNTHPNMMKTIQMADGSLKTLSYPSAKGYFLLVNGEIVKQSDSFQTIEKAYIKEVKDNAYETHGHYDLAKHELVENKIRLK